jgi:DnaJ-class molecular chaperone
MSERKFHCQILGVSESATLDEIKKAYRNLAKLHHPDLHSNSETAKKKFQQLHDSYEFLLRNTFKNSQANSENTTTKQNTSFKNNNDQKSKESVNKRKFKTTDMFGLVLRSTLILFFSNFALRPFLNSFLESSKKKSSIVKEKTYKIATGIFPNIECEFKDLNEKQMDFFKENGKVYTNQKCGSVLRFNTDNEKYIFSNSLAGCTCYLNSMKHVAQQKAQRSISSNALKNKKLIKSKLESPIKNPFTGLVDE